MPHSKGFRGRRDARTDDPTSIGDVLEGLLQREEVFSRGLPIATLVSGWPGVVGERLAAKTAPVSLDAGVLVVSAPSGPWGVQLGFLAEEIRRKANEALGSEDVRRVRVVILTEQQNRR